jgi:hypothetical protein
LPKEQRQVVMRQAIQTEIAKGSFTREDLRAAMADAKTEREARQQQRGPVTPQRKALQTKVREKVAAERERYAKASPEEQAEIREQRRAVIDKQKRLRELRQQLADAPPEAKPAIRSQIRVIRQEIAASVNNAAPAGEGNVDPAR